jgi:hypothetical protein
MEIWKKIRTSFPVWFFDATGGIFPKLDDQNDIQFYSIVCSDTLNKKNIPLYEFATAKNTQLSITKHLKTLKHIITNDFKNISLIAPIIVIDECSALLNAILDVFNNGFILIRYLEWAFDVIHETIKEKEKLNIINNLVNTRPIICNTHLFANFVKKSNKILGFKSKKNNKDEETKSEIKRLFNFCVTLLINSTVSLEFDENLIDTFKIFCKKNHDIHVKEAIDRVEKQVNLRNLGNVYSQGLYMPKYKLERKFEDVVKKDELLKDEDIEIADLKAYISNENRNGSNQTLSPFTSYFNKLLKKEEEICKEQEKLGSKPLLFNQYYNPSLFKLIENKLYIMPLWSGILIKQCQDQLINKKLINEQSIFLDLTRLTNNPVELRFNHLKTSTISSFPEKSKGKKLMTSEIVYCTFNNIKSIWNEFFKIKVENLILAKKKEISSIFMKYKKKPKQKTSIYYSRTFKKRLNPGKIKSRHLKLKTFFPLVFS